MAIHFASDNNSGVIPEVLKMLAEVNTGHVPSYGQDEFTQKANAEIERVFGKGTFCSFVFNGTAANVLALKAMVQSYQAVICSEHSHLQNSECNAPEFLTGAKLLLCPSKDAKLTVDLIQKHMIRLGDQHSGQPKVISITQPTELGTVYSLDEIREIVNFAKKHNLYVHVDGSRLVQAASYLNLSPRALTRDLGVDIVSFGGTKNGLLGGEAILYWNKDWVEPLKYIRKQCMQLAGKMRFVSCQFTAWLANDKWKDYADHSCKMAKLLEASLKEISQVKITQKVETNVVFAILPKEIISSVRKKYHFYVWDEKTFECRLMTSFDTQPEDIREFIEVIRASLK